MVHSVMVALMAEATHQCTPPAPPHLQPLVLSHLLCKPHLTEMFKAIGKWSGAGPGSSGHQTGERVKRLLSAVVCRAQCVTHVRTYILVTAHLSGSQTMCEAKVNMTVGHLVYVTLDVVYHDCEPMVP